MSLRILFPSLLCLAVFCAGSGALADCNGNGRSDSEDIDEGSSLDCDRDGIPDECQNDPLELALNNDVLRLDGIPRVVRAADLDGDGDADIVAGFRAARTEGRLTFFANDGGGSLAPRGELPLAGDFSYLSLGDFDRDGAVDIVTAGRAAGGLLRNRGDFRFEPVAEFPADDVFARPHLADLDGDGLPEIVAASPSLDTLSVWEPAPGGPEGSWTVSRSIPIEGGVRTFSLGALDAGGRLAAVVALDSGGAVLVVPLGGIDPPLTTRVDLAGEAAAAVVLVDLDRDGDGDLAASTELGIETFLRDPDGHLVPSDILDGTRAPLIAADLNDDGDVDLAVATPSPQGALVHSGDGTGRFFMPRPLISGMHPIDLTAADLDGDGTIDLVGGASSPAGIFAFVSAPLRGGVVVTSDEFPLDNCVGGRTPCRPHGAAVGDVDGDGWIDVVTSIPLPAALSVSLNRGTRSFELQTNTSIPGEHPFSMALGDVDDDGHLDAVTVDDFVGELHLHHGRGDGTFAVPHRYDFPDRPFHVRLGDVDGDGGLDAVTANFFEHTVTLLPRGAGADDRLFDRSGAVDLQAGLNPRATALADMDADGRLDILVANEAEGTVGFLRNRGERKFDPMVARPAGLDPSFVTTADIDRDGDPDVAMCSMAATFFTVLLNNGRGGLGEPRKVPGGRQHFSLSTADFDGDGWEDLIGADEIQDSVTLVFGGPDVTFGRPFRYPGGTGLRYALPADFDNDGDIDIVTSNRVGTSISLLWNDALAETELDHRESICTVSQFRELAAPTRRDSTVRRAVKFLLPVDAQSPPVPLVFQNSRRHALHQEFLAAVFGDVFPVLDSETYFELVGPRATRELFAGTISHHVTDNARFWGFDIFALHADPQEALDPAEVGAIHERLSAAFRLEPLVYAPRSAAAIFNASSWPLQDFGVFLGGLQSESDFDAYTRGVGVGRVRRLDAEAMRVALAGGTVGFQDLLVLERAPADIEGVVAGVFTAEPQGELSHLSVRTARRGTPNAFVRDALEVFEEWDDRLVRVDVRADGFDIEEISLQEAQEFWTSRRPELSELPSVRADVREIATLQEIAARETVEPDSFKSESVYGGKAAQMARLDRVLEDVEPALRADGLAVPVSHYLDFLDANRIPAFGDPTRQVTYRQFIEEAVADEDFRSDSRLRFLALDFFRDYGEDHGVVPQPLLEELRERLPAIFGEADRKLRFRSSSNVEDILEFNGAGLYESTSGCVADDLDADADGPSRCDATEDDERGLARALKRVWMSLWTFRAFEERSFFGIPHDRAAMGILITRAFTDELANGVAFSGHPGRPGDDRFLVIAQAGEESVVAPRPGVVAEKSLLDLREGELREIVRARSSSLLPPGSFVLSDAQLAELASVVARVAEVFPVETFDYSPREILLDFEFKIDAAGELAVKQVRPFLDPIAPGDFPQAALQIAAGTESCDMFQLGRTVLESHALQSRIRWRSGTFELDTAHSRIDVTLVDELDLGSQPRRAVSAGDGHVRFAVRTVSSPPVFEGSYQETFTLDDGRQVELRLDGLRVQATPGVSEPVALDLVSDVLERGGFLRATVTDEAREDDLIVYGPCDHQSLPAWDIRFELSDGAFFVLQERFRPEPFGDSGPAALTRAEAWIGEASRHVTDPWRLVYAARRHNEAVRYLVVFARPVAVEGLPRAVAAVELAAPEPVDGFAGEAIYYDSELTILDRLQLRAFSRRAAGDAPRGTFRRGDVNEDGVLEIADALALLTHLFLGGRAPRCADAADSNDDAMLDASDAIATLLHLFRGAGPLPAPFESCGVDPTDDALSCARFDPCPR